MALNQGWQLFLREQFVIGSRVKVRECADPESGLAPGMTGTLTEIDENGGFHVRLDSGAAATLRLGEDRFLVEPPEAHTLKLYMPLTGDAFEPDEDGDMNWEPIPMDAHELMSYANEITTALLHERMPEEAERGVMHWYGDDDSVDRKVRSAVFTVEPRDGKLWGVAECRVTGELTEAELERLKDYISGQASDGWGEGFEQRDIDYGGGCHLNVHLWNSGKDWSIQTEEERFGPAYAEGLPEMCWSTLAVTGELICIKRGERGYYPSDWNTADRQRNREIADFANEERCITKAQEQAMVCGSMNGWRVPGADPKTYEQESPQMGGMSLE